MINSEDNKLQISYRSLDNTRLLACKLVVILELKSLDLIEPPLSYKISQR